MRLWRDAHDAPGRSGAADSLKETIQEAY